MGRSWLNQLKEIFKQSEWRWHIIYLAYLPIKISYFSIEFHVESIEILSTWKVMNIFLIYHGQVQHLCKNYFQSLRTNHFNW